MLYLTPLQKSAIILHARKESPNEACGILAGTGGSIKKIYAMANADKSETSFLMDPKEQLRIMKDMRQNNLEMLAIYHSHPATEAYPSARDVEMAFYPEVEYVIVSLKGDAPRLRSFEIKDGKIKELEIKEI